jgi:glycerol kinase
MTGFILAIDQGTTSSRAIVFDGSMKPVGSGQKEFAQHFPASGWVEHDPEEIWSTVVWSVQEALKRAGRAASDISAIGITNQRETVVIWDRATGEPIHNAIVWQDRRTAELCQKLKSQGLEPKFTQKTGLLLDPYFSGTKIAWLLDNVEGARKRAEKGELLAGTIDSFLIWRLTGGKAHATDATNASRTLVYNIEKNEWDAELLDILRIPAALLPEVKDCADDYGFTEKSLFGAEIPIMGVAGDQQAATIGQACFEPGMMKSTYGTGCFALLNIGETPVASKNRLLTTIAYHLGARPSYALAYSDKHPSTGTSFRLRRRQTYAPAPASPTKANEVGSGTAVIEIDPLLNTADPSPGPKVTNELPGPFAPRLPSITTAKRLLAALAESKKIPVVSIPNVARTRVPVKLIGVPPDKKLLALTSAS